MCCELLRYVGISASETSANACARHSRRPAAHPAGRAGRSEHVGGPPPDPSHLDERSTISSSSIAPMSSSVGSDPARSWSARSRSDASFALDSPAPLRSSSDAASIPAAVRPSSAPVAASTRLWIVSLGGATVELLIHDRLGEHGEHRAGVAHPQVELPHELHEVGEHRVGSTQRRVAFAASIVRVVAIEQARLRCA